MRLKRTEDGKSFYFGSASRLKIEEGAGFNVYLGFVGNNVVTFLKKFEDNESAEKFIDEIEAAYVRGKKYYSI